MAQISEAFFKGGRRYSISVPFALLARWNSNHAQGDEAEVKFIEEFMDDSITNYEIEFTPGRLAGSIDNAVVEEELVKNGRSDRAFMNFLEKIGGADRPDGDANVWVPKNEARFKRYYVHAVNDEVINTDYAEDDELRRWLDDNYGGQFHRFEQAIEDSLSPLDFDDLSESEVEEALQKLGEEIASDAKDRFFDGRPVTSFKFVSADTDNKTMVFEVECSEKLSEESLAKLVHDINNWCENYDDQETEIGFADGMLELWIAMGAASVAKGYHRTKKALVAKQQNTDSELSTRVKKFKNKAVSVINPFKNKAMSVINPVINKAKKGAGKMLRRAASAMGEMALSICRRDICSDGASTGHLHCLWRSAIQCWAASVLSGASSMAALSTSSAAPSCSPFSSVRPICCSVISLWPTLSAVMSGVACTKTCHCAMDCAARPLSSSARPRLMWAGPNSGEICNADRSALMAPARSPCWRRVTE